MIRPDLPRARGWLLPMLFSPLLAGCSAPGPRGATDAPALEDAYLAPTAALVWPGATRGFQVMPSGDLFNGEWEVRIRPSAGVPAESPRVIAYRDRWLPVTNWVRRSGPVEWDFEAVAIPGAAPRDTGIAVSLRIRAVNTSNAESEARIELSLALPDTVPVFVAWDAPEPPVTRFGWAGSSSPDPAYGLCPGEVDGSRVVQSWRLGPGQSKTVRVILPAYPEPRSRLDALSRRPHASQVAEVARYWKSEVARGTRFDLGDPEVENAMRAATVVLLGCRERRGPYWVPIGGPFHYRDVWMRDGARAAHGLALAGQTRIARELAAGLAQLQWPNGAFVTQRGQPDGTGQALWLFDQVLLRPGPADSLGPFVARAQLAWRWVEWQRAMGKQAGWPLGPMLPFADPRDAELVRAQLVGTDAWALAGYRALERLLRAQGLGSQADTVAATRRAYLADFERSLALTGSLDIPPSWQGIGRDWGNLAASWPCGAIAPGDPRARALARRAWAEAGGAGLTIYGHRDSLHYYVGADLATWALLAGEREAADSVLSALLHWRNASGAAGELFSRAGDFGRNVPPHPTAAAALVTLVRHCLLLDDDDTLRITAGARSRWWSGSRVSKAPTRWGVIDLSFRRTDDVATWRWTPVSTWSVLSLPPGTVLAAAPEPPLVAAGASSVLAPPGARSARVRLTQVVPPAARTP